MVSDRAQKGLNIPSLSSIQNNLYTEDPYHKNNKEGYIKLSSADNVLSEDLIKAKFDSIDWKKFDKNSLFFYPRCGGEISTLESVSNFINKFCRKGLPPIPANDFIIVPGVTTGADLLGQILFDSEDIVLVPAPYYYRFANDFGERSLVEIGIVPALSKCETFTQLSGKVVKAVTLVNPQNPEGGIFDIEEMRSIINWALDRNLYIVLDEIYDLCIYNSNSKKFQTATELFNKNEETRQKLIWLWGISKNFSLAGLRFAVLYTPNLVVRTACKRFLMHHLPNTLTQFVTRQFLDDHDWIEKSFLPTNLMRLKIACDQVITELNKYNVKYLKPCAGFFILVDFSNYLESLTIEAEQKLHQKFLKHKVILSAGETMIAPKPGWFRIVFSSINSIGLKIALERIGNALTEQKNELLLLKNK